MSLKTLLAKLVLQNPKIEFDNNHEEVDEQIQNHVLAIVNGHYFQLLQSKLFSEIFFQNNDILTATQNYVSSNGEDLLTYINTLTDILKQNINSCDISEEHKKIYTLIIAILFLQFFVVANFSGPKLPFELSDKEIGFMGLLFTTTNTNTKFKFNFQTQSLDLLSISGYSPYHLSETPFFLVLSLHMFERLQGTSISLLGSEKNKLDSSFVIENSFDVNFLSEQNQGAYINASICWWRARVLQVQQSILPEISSEIITLSLELLGKKTVNALIDTVNVNSKANQYLLISYYLENANISIAGDLEVQTLDFILNANKASGMSLILTGCKARMTKHQTKSTATLTVLAKSSNTLLSSEESEKSFKPQDVQLNDDLFLEKPNFDSLGDNEILKDEETNIENDFTKRIKIDYSTMNDEIPTTIDKKLIPIAVKESDIPAELNNIDPNDQPTLANLDNIQLLLRMQAIYNNTPDGNTLVNEELIAVIQRVLFSSSEYVNWLIFSRALWYRSLLETARSRTVERGVLQLYSLVEELGVTSEHTARLFPKTDDEVKFPTEFRNSTDITVALTNATRLRYIYTLPLMPKWSMDTKLAEKLMELGSLKSALEIYERLEKWTDAALCYAATGDSDKGVELVEKALQYNPNDARSWSVLGDIKNDPSLWEKAWSIGRYANAKRSLAKFYSNPPKDSNVEKNLQTAISHMFDCLSANPINFQNWYFYGCMGLEVGNYELAAEAFTRCVSLDDSNSYAWSNLASALIQLDKISEAFTALQKSVNSGDSTKKSWKIWENYLIVAVKLGKWDEVLHASIVLLNDKKDLDHSTTSIDIPIVEKIADLLTSDPFDANKRETYFQKTATDFICNMIPSVVNSDSRIWRIVAKVDFWRKKPWLALEDYEKSYRAVINNPDLTSDENVWKIAVEACQELVSAYENFGELEGRHGAGDVVCKDWKFKAKSTIRSLISKGKSSWEYTDGFEALQELKQEIMNS